MQPQLTTRNGNIIPLTDEIYETILQVVKNRSDFVERANSIEELEGEFSELFAEASTPDELLAEHAHELARETRQGLR